MALTAFGPTVVNALGHGAVMPVLALRARELGADVGTAALVVALLGIGQVLTSLPAGALVARVGERRALFLAGAVDTVAMVGASLAGSVVALGAAVVVSGATWTVFLIARQGYMIDVVPGGERARAMSTLGGSHRIGLLVGPFVGSGLIALSGLPAVFLLAAAMSAAAGPARAPAARHPAPAHGRGRPPAAGASTSCAATGTCSPPWAARWWSSGSPARCAPACCRCGPSPSASTRRRPRWCSAPPTSSTSCCSTRPAW